MAETNGLPQLCHHGFKNRAEFWNPQNLVYQFVAEARRLWELERGQMELTTIHAAMIIHLIYEMNGFDKLGWPYTVEAIAIARDLHLFEPCPDGDDGDMRAARLYTAWSLFAWQRCAESWKAFSASLLTRTLATIVTISFNRPYLTPRPKNHSQTHRRHRTGTESSGTDIH